MAIKTGLPSDSFYLEETASFPINIHLLCCLDVILCVVPLMRDSFKHIFFWRKGILSVFILLTVGCTPQLFWAKSGAQPGEFEEDVSQCRETIISNSGQQGTSKPLSLNLKVSEDAMEQCLMAKNWILAEKP
jgi:hypothetical protein